MGSISTPLVRKRVKDHDKQGTLNALYKLHLQAHSKFNTSGKAGLFKGFSISIVSTVIMIAHLISNSDKTERTTVPVFYEALTNQDIAKLMFYLKNKALVESVVSSNKARD